MLELLDAPAVTIVAVAAFAGLRRGELKGLRWEDYTSPEHEGDLAMVSVRRSAWRQFITDPKSEESKNTVPLIPQAAEYLDRWRATCGNPATGTIFPNAKGGPRDLDALYRRSMADVLTRAGIRWRGWHSFRRFAATVLDRNGTIDTTIQRVLRHADVQTTRRAYIAGGNATEATEALKKMSESTEIAKCSSIVLQRTQNRRPGSGSTAVQ